MNVQLEVFSFVIASIILAFSPGPDNIFVLMTSLTEGFKASLKFILGLISGILIHTGLIILGVSELIKNSKYGLLALKIFATSYLIWLAMKTFIHRQDPLELKQKQNKTVNFYLRGLVMNLTNPKVLLFFLAFLPTFAQLEKQGYELRLLILGGLFALVTLFAFGFIAWVAGKGIKQRIQNPQIVLGLNWLAIIVFIAMAGFIALQSI